MGVCETGEADVCTRTCPHGGAEAQPGPVSSAGWCRGVGTCALLAHRWAHTQSSVSHGGEGRTNRSQCPSPCPHVTYPPDRVPAAGLGVSTVWGPAGGQERFPEAPTGFPSPGPREKRSPARKPLRRCPHYITDIPATRPATLRRGASGNPSRASAFRPGRRAGRAAPSPRSGRWAASSPRPCAQGQRPQEGARAGRRRGRG